MARILAFEKPEISRELAKLVVEHQNRVLAEKEYFDVAVSGGSLAQTLSDGLVGNKDVKFPKWRVWLADERVVPLDDPDSNMGLFIKDCFSKLPKDQMPKLEALSPELLKDYDNVPTTEFAAEYQDRLIKALGPKPELDFIFLGMGPDGHTCSLFPGDALLNVSDRYVASIDNSPKPPPRRITLLKPALALGKQIVFVTTGASKSEAIHKVFTQNDTSLPAKQVNDISQTDVLWFADKAALGGA